MKSAVISIIGRPSSGKSTLLNTICHRKISIVSSVPQTTRNKIRGILTTEDGQLVFIDTPGYHNSKKKYNLCLKKLALSSLSDIDIVLYVIDAARSIGEEEKEIWSLLKKHRDKTIIAINKVDIAANTDNLRQEIEANFENSKIFSVSALKKEGIKELTSCLFESAPEGEYMYPPDFYTDQHPEFRAAEIIREKAITKVKEEIPHALYVEIADMEISSVKLKGGETEERLWIRAFLAVERESQKGILIGKKGAVIKAIRMEAQNELNDILPYKVNLDLRVKLKYKWRRKDFLLKDIIH